MLHPDLVVTDVPLAVALTDVSYASVQEAIQTLLTANWQRPGPLVGQALQTVSKYTNITDNEWLMEVFSTASARTAEQAMELFNVELVDNAKPFLL